MKRFHAAIGGLLALTLTACQATVDGESGGFDAARAYARLTTMAGAYEVEFPGEPERSKVIWENVSGGHAVMEKLNVGTPHEMVSLYYLEGEELALTHYCAAGNRPLLRLDRARSTRDELFFVFDPATTGIDPRTDGHIHAARFQWLDADSVDVTWSFWAEGAEQHARRFQLRRKPAEAEAAAPAESAAPAEETAVPAEPTAEPAIDPAEPKDKDDTKDDEQEPRDGRS
jgi:hypothetical protein